MMQPIQVAVLVGSTTDPAQYLTSTLGGHSFAELTSALSSPVSLSVISWLPAADVGDWPDGTVTIALAHGRQTFLVRFLGHLGLTWLTHKLMKFPAGRLVNSFSPIDQSRIFRRALRRDAAAHKALSNAAIVIAADLPAVKAAWATLRSGTCKHAFYGLPAAIGHLGSDIAT